VAGSSSASKAWDLVPQRPTLARVREAAAGCRACELWKRATQTVFGEGSPGAEVMLVGEEPGDRADVEGHPFVGAAGKLLDWEPRGKRRIHKKPNAEHIAACRPWLETELKLVGPKTLVCLGATAAQTILGRSFRLTQHADLRRVADVLAGGPSTSRSASG
jgi:uracil-DNA glycosylase